MSETAPEPRAAEANPRLAQLEILGRQPDLPGRRLSGVRYWAWSAFTASPYNLPARTRISPAGSAIKTVIVAPGSLPDVAGPLLLHQIRRAVDPHTDIPKRETPLDVGYTVKRGDCLSKFASNFGLKWQSILWANTATLKTIRITCSPVKRCTSSPSTALSTSGRKRTPWIRRRRFQPR